MKKHRILRLAAMAAAILLGLPPGWGWAAEGSANWRPTYDTVMMWVNFVILVVLLVKYLRAPAKRFLSDYRSTLENEISQLTARKEKAAGDLRRFEESLHNQRQEWENRHQKILAQGERDRLALITEAREQAHRLLENANRQIDARVQDAARQLQGEIVDNAIETASKELPGRMTPEIQQRWLRHFLGSISKAPPPRTE
jgi:F-type H+-transporting ATPase subunit b